MSEFGQQLVNGITLGSVYALIALGFTLIFGVLRVIAFVQGGIYMLGAFAGLGVALAAGSLGPGTTLVLAVAAGAGAGAVSNMAVDRIGYRPLRRSPNLMALISGIGLYTFIENFSGILFGRQPRAFPALLPSGRFRVAGVSVTTAQVVVVALAVACMIGLYLYVEKTGIGLAMRATAERAETASLMGIEPERVILVTFAVSGALSGVAGVLVGTYVGIATPTMGFLIGIKAFTAAVIGGIGNVRGSLVGGLVIGMIEALGTGYVSSAWGDALVFAALVTILLVRPAGLFGRVSLEKV
jgi:branched-chain amino acid transport system permease protein